MPDIYGIEKNFEIAEFILQEEKEALGMCVSFPCLFKVLVWK